MNRNKEKCSSTQLRQKRCEVVSIIFGQSINQTKETSLNKTLDVEVDLIYTYEDRTGNSVMIH